MLVVRARYCGLDVHKKTMTACALITNEVGRVQKTVRTFETVTAEFVTLNDWLETLGITHMAIESTGIYRPPLSNLPEDGRTVRLVNGRHIQAVPGRKTHVRAAEWIADVWLNGMTAAGIPCGPINTIEQALEHPQIQHRGMIVDVQHPTEGSVRVVGPPVIMSDTPAEVRSHPPLLGEHTDEILHERLGLSDEAIARLREAGAI